MTENELTKEELVAFLDYMGNEGHGVSGCELLPVRLARQLLGQTVRAGELDADIERLREVMRRVSQMLKTPASEYVPIVSEAWNVLDGALCEQGWGSNGKQ